MRTIGLIEKPVKEDKKAGKEKPVKDTKPETPEKEEGANDGEVQE